MNELSRPWVNVLKLNVINHCKGKFEFVTLENKKQIHTLTFARHEARIYQIGYHNY